MQINFLFCVQVFIISVCFLYKYLFVFMLCFRRELYHWLLIFFATQSLVSLTKPPYVSLRLIDLRGIPWRMAGDHSFTAACLVYNYYLNLIYKTDMFC